MTHIIKPITSMADFYQKVKTDKRYELVAIYTYKMCVGSSSNINYATASRWIERWLKDSCKGVLGCKPMVDCLNKYIDEVERKNPHPIPQENKL